MKPTYFKSSSAFRTWLRVNHRSRPELWVGLRKKASGKPTVSYPEAVDQALCFGWIDGVRKSVDAAAYMIRFTPRKPQSQWSTINIARVKSLMAAGRMRQAGRRAFEGAEKTTRAYSDEQRNSAKLSPGDEHQFRSHPRAWEFFQSQPPWYRRTATWWIISARKEETRQRRLALLIADSAAARAILPLTRKSAKVKPQKQAAS